MIFVLSYAPCPLLELNWQESNEVPQTQQLKLLLRLFRLPQQLYLKEQPLLNYFPESFLCFSSCSRYLCFRQFACTLLCFSVDGRQCRPSLLDDERKSEFLHHSPTMHSSKFLCFQASPIQLRGSSAIKEILLSFLRIGLIFNYF